MKKRSYLGKNEKKKRFKWIFNTVCFIKKTRRLTVSWKCLIFIKLVSVSNIRELFLKRGSLCSFSPTCRWFRFKVFTIQSVNITVWIITFWYVVKRWIITINLEEEKTVFFLKQFGWFKLTPDIENLKSSILKNTESTNHDV